MKMKWWVFPLVAAAGIILFLLVSHLPLNETVDDVPPKITGEETSSDRPDLSPASITKTKTLPLPVEREKESESITSPTLFLDTAATDTAPLLRIYGFVNDEKSVSIAGATLWTMVAEDDLQRRLGKEVARTRSNERGQYEMFVPTGASYIAFARAGEYSAIREFLPKTRTISKKEIRIDFTLSIGVAIRGTVKDTEGNPVPGARIAPSYTRSPGEGRFEALARQIPPDELSVLADESGRFSLVGLYPGLYNLAASKQGFVPTIKNGAPCPSENQVIVLEKGTGALIAGRVYALVGGGTIGEAKVSIRSDPFTPQPLSVVTNTEGEFRFTDLIPGVFEISAEKDQLRSVPHESIDLTKFSEKTYVELFLFEGYTISGHVYEQGGTEILADVKITARTNLREDGISDTSDQEGAYLISGIFDSSVFLHAEREGYFQAGNWGPNSPLQVKLSPDKPLNDNIDISMSRGVKVSGRVVTASDEQPISGAQVQFITDARIFRRRRQPMNTDAGGRFSGYVHNHSRLTIRAEHKDYTGESTNPMRISDEPVEDVLIKLGRGGRIQGIVVSPDQEPIPGATVKGRAPTPSVGRRGRTSAPYETLTGDDGRFFLEQAPAGEFFLYAEAEDYTPSKREVVTVPEGGETEQVTLVLKAPHFIEGIVKDDQEGFVEGAKVQARNVKIWRRKKTAYSDQDGLFRIENLPRGTYRVHATKGDSTSKYIQVKQDATNLVLILKNKERCALDGCVLDIKTDEAVTFYTIKDEKGRTSYGTYADEQGRFRIDDLVRGRRYRFLIKAPGYVQTLTPFVRIPKQGTPPEALFRIGRGGSIFGRVIYDINNIPVEGAKVTWNKKGQRQSGPSLDQVGFTGSDGAFLFERLAPELYQLKIEKATYPEMLLECRVKNGEITDLGEIKLKASGKIVGIIYDDRDPPMPVPDKIIRLSSLDRPVSILLSYETGPDGRYRFEDLPQGQYSIKPVGGEYKEKKIDLASGDKKTLDFFPRRGK